MADLLWPGDHRAGATFSDGQVVAAMVRVERAWLAELAESGIAPSGAAGLGASPPTAGDDEDPWLLGDDTVHDLAVAGEAAGNPAVPLVTLLRSRLPEPAATWVHRGLTSQDVVDTALMLCATDALDRIAGQLARQVARTAALVTQHRAAPMLARTLTQPAIPTTAGAHLAGWLSGLLDAADGLDAARPWLRAQIGGAAGTLAAVTELAHGRGLADPAGVAMRSAQRAAGRLRLAWSVPWHTSRGPVTRIGDAFAGCTDAWGRIARDVLTGSRAEIGELHEHLDPGSGGSSTMPGKRNPVLAVLLHRAALAAPALAGTLHTAAATANDDRPDGAWHAEWAPLRTLARHAVAAAEQATELLDGLTVDTARMSENLAAAGDVLAEQRTMSRLAGAAPAGAYTGAADPLIETVLDRARDRSGASERAAEQRKTEQRKTEQRKTEHQGAER